MGENVTFYSKTFHLYRCDKFTRDFLESQGILVGADEEEIPQDPHTLSRRVVEQPNCEYQSPSDFDKLKQFVSLDRKVLRFDCLWDDRESLHGEIRYLTLHYFLVDDSLEIREVHAANNGRDQAPTLVRRGPVPRNHRDVAPDFPSVVLEKSVHEQTDNIGPEDLAIGATVTVYGRPIFLYNCDPFTQEFYRRNFGVTDFTPIDVGEPPAQAKAPELPPPTGFGTHEDSLQSVLSLRPKQPKQNMLKLLEHDNKTLRFVARMETKDPIDKDRSFIVQ